jgi:hypothetical protein
VWLHCRVLSIVCGFLLQVLKVLSGSGLLLKAQLIMAAADALRGHIQPVISTAKQQGLCPADMFSRAAITWATGICLSRTVRLDDRSGEVVLCPFADLFNHSCDSKAFLLWDPKQRAVVLKADRPYKPGDQVCAVLRPDHIEHAYYVHPSCYGVLANLKLWFGNQFLSAIAAQPTMTALCHATQALGLRASCTVLLYR